MVQPNPDVPHGETFQSLTMGSGFAGSNHIRACAWREYCRKKIMAEASIYIPYTEPGCWNPCMPLES